MRSVSTKPLALVALHWMIVATLVVAFLTGMRIASDSEGAWAQTMNEYVPQGAVFVWHRLAGLALLSLLLGYGAFLAVTGGWRRFVGPGKEAAHSNTGAWLSRLNRALYWLALLLLSVSVLTGLVQYFHPLSLPMVLVETVHQLVAWTLLGFVASHVIVQLVMGGWRRLLSIFLPKPVLLPAGILAIGAALSVGAGMWLWDRHTTELPVVPVSHVPRIDGQAHDKAWTRAIPQKILTANGANFQNGQTTVTLRAVRDEEKVYFLFEWPDPTRSQKHLPLIKQEQGWQVQQTAFLQADETRYYEDKFAVMLARQPLAALASIHLGRQPLAEEPGPSNERGLHYTTDGSVLDVWHWKSVRTNPSRQADDNHFGPPADSYMLFTDSADSSRPGHQRARQRYTGGYRKDPPMTWNGYSMNWEYFSADRMRPRRLPEDRGDVAHLQQADWSPAVSDRGDWWLEWNDTEPYSPARDDWPVGTVLPLVLIKGPRGGDRGHVDAYGEWRDGVWRLEMSRVLATGSPNDVALADGTYLWVAAFDHSQTRHTYHLRPLRLRFVEPIGD